MQSLFPTIAAPVTPLSVGGVGIIRISGEKSFEIARAIFSRDGAGDSACASDFKVGKVNHGWILRDAERPRSERDFKKEQLDEVILLAFKAPNSFTGEDVIEIHSHGSPVIIREILNLAIACGAQLAARGEFSKRAFLNGKIDLSQAEAILDLIHAKNLQGALNSAKNLGGALTKGIGEIKLEVTEILGKIIASLDFPDDVKEVEYSEIEAVLQNSIKKIEKILENAHCHNILREGIKIAIVGCPNVGKSSLFNALLALERAIVTDIAGTTRDTIRESIDIKGLSATLIDTAGIREGKNIDVVEKIGVENSRDAINEADLVLCLYDASLGITSDDRAVFALVPQEKVQIMVATKADIASTSGLKTAQNHATVSSLTLDGIEKLKDLIFNTVLGLNSIETEFLTNQRQQECLKNTLLALETALNATLAYEMQDLISIDIKQALISLDEITGEVVTDDVLTHIFENFCIGK